MSVQAETPATSSSGLSPETTGAQRRNAALRRTLIPRSIAIVGLSDTSNFKELVIPTLSSDAEVFMVNPRYATVLGLPTVPSLTALDRPIDVVMSFMSAERSTALVEEAAAMDVGGMVLIAGGYAEMDAAGEALQRRIKVAADASEMALMGPNGLGFVNVPHRISLTIAGDHKRRPGGISIISQSGAMLSGIAMAAWFYESCGLNLLISAGNEAVTDLADYIDYLVEDPETTSIGLVIEKIRRPAEFFAAVARATAANKPVVALKLARSERTQRMAASHTGSLTGDAWVYDVALRQAGVDLAYDPEELIDRLALFEQIDRSRWTGIRNLGVVTMTGGFASLSQDLALAEGVNIPALESFDEWVSTSLPGITVPNPLDTTGLGLALWPEIVDRYAGSDELDAIMVIHPLAEEDQYAGDILVKEFVRAAGEVHKPAVLVNCSGAPGEWVKQMTDYSVALGRGLRPTIRGLATLGRFARFQERVSTRPAAAPVPALRRPAATPIVQPEGLMLPFDDTMKLLSANGIPVSAYQMVPTGTVATEVRPSFAGPWVAKLADVAHRTEHDAVRLRVTPETLAGVITELRKLAAGDGLSPVVVIQPMVVIDGEALLGIQGTSELGPLVVFGLGGVMVEVLNRVSGRMAPFGLAEAEDLIEEFRDIKLMHGFRGKPPWDLNALAQIILNAGRFASGAADWLGSLDVNPLVWGPDGFQAVDALLLLRN